MRALRLSETLQRSLSAGNIVPSTVLISWKRRLMGEHLFAFSVTAPSCQQPTVPRVWQGSRQIRPVTDTRDLGFRPIAPPDARQSRPLPTSPLDKR